MPKVTKKQITSEVHAQIITLSQLGWSHRQISDQLDVPRSTVGDRIRAYRRNGGLGRAPGSGRKRLTSERDDAVILREVKRNRFITAAELKEELKWLKVSHSTIYRRIKENGEFGSYVAARKPFLREVNVEKRLAWAKEHENWTVEQWKSVLWSDESPFVLRFKRKLKVWRRKGERYLTRCTIATVKHDVKINVWGCFRARGVGRLHKINGIRDDILIYSNFQRYNDCRCLQKNT